MTVRAKCLAQEHNTMSPARAQTRTTHSGVKCTNHEALRLLHTHKKNSTILSAQFMKERSLILVGNTNVIHVFMSVF